MHEIDTPFVAEMVFRDASLSGSGTNEYHGVLARWTKGFDGAPVLDVDARGARTPKQLADDGHDLKTLVDGINAAMLAENDALKTKLATLEQETAALQARLASPEMSDA